MTFNAVLTHEIIQLLRKHTEVSNALPNASVNQGLSSDDDCYGCSVTGLVHACVMYGHSSAGFVH